MPAVKADERRERVPIKLNEPRPIERGMARIGPLQLNDTSRDIHRANSFLPQYWARMPTISSRPNEVGLDLNLGKRLIREGGFGSSEPQRPEKMGAGLGDRGGSDDPVDLWHVGACVLHAAVLSRGAGAGGNLRSLPMHFDWRTMEGPAKSAARTAGPGFQRPAPSPPIRRGISTLSPKARDVRGASPRARLRRCGRRLAPWPLGAPSQSQHVDHGGPHHRATGDRGQGPAGATFPRAECDRCAHSCCWPV